MGQRDCWMFVASDAPWDLSVSFVSRVSTSCLAPALAAVPALHALWLYADAVWWWFPSCPCTRLLTLLLKLHYWCWSMRCLGTHTACRQTAGIARRLIPDGMNLRWQEIGTGGWISPSFSPRHHHTSSSPHHISEMWSFTLLSEGYHIRSSG